MGGGLDFLKVLGGCRPLSEGRVCAPPPRTRLDKPYMLYEGVLSIFSIFRMPFCYRTTLHTIYMYYVKDPGLKIGVLLILTPHAKYLSLPAFTSSVAIMICKDECTDAKLFSGLTPGGSGGM